MSDSVSEIRELCELLADHKATNTTAIYVGEVSSVTDYFVIATGTSSTHLNGLFRRVVDFAKQRGYQPFGNLKQSGDSGWLLLDCGPFVVHLMSQELRQFYDLERLWFHGETVFHAGESSPSDDGSDASSSVSSS